MNINKKIIKCQNCGAPTTKEICEYCKGVTGIDKNGIELEYPIIECRETNINKISVNRPLFIALIIGIATLYILINAIKIQSVEGYIISFILGALCLLFLNLGMTPFIRKNILENKGEEIEAIVYGYLKDEFIVNGQPTQIIELLIDTNKGKRFILYQLEHERQPYKLNEKIKLKKYGDIFEIIEEEKYYFE